MAEAVGEQGGWAAVVKQKAEPVLRKRNNFNRHFSFLVIQDGGFEHWGITDKMPLIAKQREYWGFIPFYGKPGLRCDKFHAWPQIVSKPSLNLASCYQPTLFYSLAQIRANAVSTTWLKICIFFIFHSLIWANFFCLVLLWVFLILRLVLKDDNHGSWLWICVGCFLMLRKNIGYLKCDSFKAGGFCWFFMGSSKKSCIFLILREERGKIERFPPLSCSCVSMVVLARVTLANNLSDFAFVPHSCVASAVMGWNCSNSYKLDLAAVRQDDFSAF